MPTAAEMSSGSTAVLFAKPERVIAEQDKVGQSMMRSGRAGHGKAGEGSCIPEDEANGGAGFVAAKGREVDEQHFTAYMLGHCICHHGFAHPTGPMEQQHQAPSAPDCIPTQLVYILLLSSVAAWRHKMNKFASCIQAAECDCHCNCQ